MRFGWSLLAAAMLAAGVSAQDGEVPAGPEVARIDAAHRLLASLAVDGDRLFIDAQGHATLGAGTPPLAPVIIAATR
jgi:hypothetical protein